MKLVKKMAIVAISLTTICTIAFSVYGVGLQHVKIVSNIFSNSIKSGFTESEMGTGSFHTYKNKVIKQCYVRLKEGSYDSNRKYSKTGKLKGGKKYIWSPELEKSNNPFATCYTNYGWLYY